MQRYILWLQLRAYVERTLTADERALSRWMPPRFLKTRSSQSKPTADQSLLSELYALRMARVAPGSAHLVSFLGMLPLDVFLIVLQFAGLERTERIDEESSSALVPIVPTKEIDAVRRFALIVSRKDLTVSSSQVWHAHMVIAPDHYARMCAVLFGRILDHNINHSAAVLRAGFNFTSKLWMHLYSHPYSCTFAAQDIRPPSSSYGGCGGCGGGCG